MGTPHNDDVFPHISYFINDILKSAHHSVKWTVQLLKTAIGWAEYIEKICSSGESREDIEQALEKLSTGDNISVTFYDLQNARRALLSALLFNQTTSEDVNIEIRTVSIDLFGLDEYKQMTMQAKKQTDLVNELFNELPLKKYFNVFKIRAVVEYVENTGDFGRLNCLLRSNFSLHLMLSLLNKTSTIENNKILVTYSNWIIKELNEGSTFMLRELSNLPVDEIEIFFNFSLEQKLFNAFKTCGDKILQKNISKQNEQYYSIVKLLGKMLHSDVKNKTLDVLSQWFTCKSGFIWRNVYEESLKMD